MSAETKKELEKVRRTFEQVEEGTKKLVEKVEKLGDKDLTKKIQKIQEGAGEIVKHIEEKSNEPG